MKVLVTGATGQVGCRLVRQLQQHNHEVRGTVWAGAPEAELERVTGLDLDLRKGDLLDLDYVRQAVAGVDAVIHTANLVGPHFENNVSTTLQVSRACAEAADKLDRFVYVSSSGVYPNDSHVLAPAYHPVDENHPKRATSEYNLSKLIGEELTELAARRTGLRTAIVRPSHVLSGDKLLAQFTVQRVVNNLKSGQANPKSELFAGEGADLWKQVEAKAEGPDQPCSVTDMDGRPWYYQPNDARDVAQLLVLTLERPEALGEAFNAGAPEPFRYPEAARMLAELSGRKPLEVKLPVQWRYDHAIGKARSWLGYAPRGSLEVMLQDAWAVKTGNFIDYDWR